MTACRGSAGGRCDAIRQGLGEGGHRRDREIIVIVTVREVDHGLA
jgi:hypothetical protein